MHKSHDIDFIFPISGDCINCRDLTAIDGKEYLKASVSAPVGKRVFISGAEAREETEGVYTAMIPTQEGRNTLTANIASEDAQKEITVFNMGDDALLSYRISSDDNIRFLMELTAGSYASIFDHPYLAVYKKAHDLYGARVHLNLFYELDEEARACFTPPLPYFNLTMMTDRYKDEFIRNSDWLKLAFHSRSEFPPRPYDNASADTITKDHRDVCREIERFAGKECISDTATVHYGSANLECTKALRKLGIRSLTGYFTLSSSGRPRVSYYASPELARHIGCRDFFVDEESDMIFAKIDSVLNTGSYDEVIKEVKDVMANAHCGGFVSVMIHEQYFYPDYKSHLADFEKRVLGAAKILYEGGYRGKLISEATKMLNKKN